MSEPHIVSAPSALDLYRENQRLAARVAELEAELSGWKVCVEHVTEPGLPGRTISSSEGWTMLSTVYAHELFELEERAEIGKKAVK